MNKKLFKPHILICVLTFKRQELLKKNLKSVLNQKNDNRYKTTLLVVDNDSAMSAKSVVDELAESTNNDIYYECEVVKNIAKARNRAINFRESDFVVFIDDDQVADENWLFELYTAMIVSDADVVNGPVLPNFEVNPPKWAIDSGFFDILGNYSNMCTSYAIKATGNCMIKRSVLNRYQNPFNEDYGITGGEDTEFFYRLENAGACFCWAAEAITYEHIPTSRVNLGWIIKRNFCSGNNLGRIVLSNKSRTKQTLWLRKKFLFNIKFLAKIPYVIIKAIVFRQTSYAWDYLFRLLFKFGKLSAYFNYIYCYYK